MAMMKFIVSLMASTLMLTSSFAAAEEQVVFTQILHRHGSRSPLPPVNQSRWCTDRGCGLLNAQGKDMLEKLGQFIRTRYDDLNPSYFPTTSYDADAISTRSSNVLRTILSAEAMLRGLYPNQTNPLTFLPIVEMVPKPTDNLLVSDSIMAYGKRISYLVSSGRLRTLMHPSLLRNFGDASTNATLAALLNTMAAEVDLQGLCEDLGFEVCLAYVQDIAVSLMAEGKDDVAPTCVANVAKLNAMLFDMNTFFYGYNLNTNGEDGDTVEDVKARGSCGQPLAQQMIANAKAYMSGSKADMPFRFMHYSAHDTTITPLAVTIGEDELYLTGYGQLVLIDLVVDNSQYYVKGIKAQPEQVPGPHAYTAAPLRLGGIDASGATYYIDVKGGSSANGTDRVLFDDFVRFVDSTKAQSVEGYCYTNAALKAFLDCGLQKDVSANCLVYRANCPQFGCPAGSYLTFPGQICVPFPSSPASNDGDSNTMKIEIVGISIAVVAVVGFAIGFVVSHVYKKRRYSHLSEAEAAEGSCNTLVGGDRQ